MRDSRDIKRKKASRIPGMLICIAQLAVSVVLFTLILRIAVLPPKELLEILFIIVALMAVTLYGLLLGRKRRALRIASYVISISLSLSFILLSSYMWKSDAFIEDVGSEPNEMYSASVIVSADSIYTKIEDLPGVRFAYVRKPVSVYVDECVREVKSMLGPMKAEHADNVSDLADLLYDGKCDAIIIDESSRAQVTETHPDFEERTRTIWALNVKHQIMSEGSEKDITREAFNIYLCGTDSRTGVDSAAMNDVNMIVTVNPTTNQILITSIPRDYYIPLASYYGSDKLSNIGAYGTEESIKTVEQFTGLKMDFYVKVGFDALVYMVDAIGGIDVESDAEFTAWTNPDVHIVKGVNHMDGVTALAYARERYAYEDGDIHRAQNQAQVMREIAWKAMSPSIIIYYSDMLDALAKGMRTSMSDEQIRNLIRLQIGKKARWDIRDVQMTGTDSMSKKCYSMPKRKLYVMIPDQESVDNALKMIEEFMNGETEALPDN